MTDLPQWPPGSGDVFPADTELAAAAALADAAANPTVPSVGSLGLVWNGATWDRVLEQPSAAAAFARAGLLAVCLNAWSGAGNARPISTVNQLADADAGSNTIGSAGYVFNGATWDRIRAAVAALTAITPTGVQQVAIAGTDGTNLRTWPFANAIGDGQATNLPLVASYIYRGDTSWDRIRTPVTFKPFASTAVTAGTGITIWTPAAGKKFRLMGWLVSTSVAAQLIFGDNAVGTVIARSETVAAAGVSQPGAGLGNGILSAAANNVLKLDVSASGNVAGMVWGTEE